MGKPKDLAKLPFSRTQMTFLLIYYYIGVKDTMTGDKLLRIPRKYLAPGSDRRGELIIDSGLGYMTRTVFNIVAAELKKQMSKYKRVIELEAATGLTLCYNFTSENSIKIPDLTYQFSSGSSTYGGAGKELFCLPAPSRFFPNHR